MQRFFRTLNLVDWLVAGACLAYGFWTGSPWWLAGGVIGLAVAWWRPAERVKTSLERRMLGRRAPAVATGLVAAPPSAPPASVSPAPASVPPAPDTSKPEPLAPLRLRPGHVHPRISKDKHNQLVPEAINRFEVPTRLRE